MTQLNLSGRHSTTAHESSSAEENSWSIRKQTLGALGALVMFAAVIGIGSCSRGNGKPAVVAQATQPSAPVPSPVVPTTAAPAPQAEQAKSPTKSKKRRPATLSYVNRPYGLSFTFPRQYSLKSGDEAQLSWGDLGPFQMDFVHPGGVTLAGVKLPDNSYPGTDFKSAFLNVSVNPAMTSEACSQFAFPDPNAGSDGSSPVKTERVKIGAIEFDEIENSSAAMMKQTDAKYYHVFSNGTCYEFALGIGTEGDGNVEGITPIDREQVFGKLEKILATVKLQPTVVPETEAPVPSAGVTAPAASSTSPESSVTDRNF
jgi:hypothetical protein